jgi:hypothetical protein
MVPRTACCLLTTAALLLIGGCSSAGGSSAGADLTVDSIAQTISFDAVIDRGVADAGSWHLIVYEFGSNSANTFFRTGVTPEAVYDALISLGAVAGNNLNSANYTDPVAMTEGDGIDITVTWAGAGQEYGLDELLLEDSALPGGGPYGIDIRFGGNYLGVPGTNPSDESGCVACLYSCPAGISSNSRANAYLHGLDGAWRYRANPAMAPPDGTQVRIKMAVAP